VFFPTENVPFRFVGLGAGAARESISDDYNILFLDSTVATALFTRPLLQGDTGLVGLGDPVATTTTSAIFGGSLYLGKRLVTTSTLRHANHEMGFDLLLLPSQDTYRVRGTLNLWEYAGSIRYNLATEKFQPYVKAGYGLSWYRLEDITTEFVGTDPAPVPISPDTTLWVRKPWRNPDGSTNAWANIWPNTWHVGAGLELIPFLSRAPIPRGLDVSLILDVAYYQNKLGVQNTLVQGVDLEGGSRDKTVGRTVVSLWGYIGF